MKKIINADDFGLNRSINLAITLCFRKGYINQTTIMTNMPAYEEAVALSKEYNFFDKVGLHVNLDEGIPITNEMKCNFHFCKNDRFIKGSIKGLKKFYLNRYDRKCVEKKVEAQMAHYICSGFPLLHLDSHHHIHTNYSILRIILKIAKKHQFRTIRICAFHSSDSFFKKLYKRILNSYVRLYFSTTDLFLTRRDQYQPESKSIEIMTHPDIIEGQLVEIIKRNLLTINSYK